jgi:4-hydroxybenzoate polyprenyltransferase
MDKDIELAKVQAIADYYHTENSFMLSFLIASFIGAAIALLSVGAERYIDIPTFFIALTIVSAVFVYEALRVENHYMEDMKRTFSLLDDIEKGKGPLLIKDIKKK